VGGYGRAEALAVERLGQAYGQRALADPDRTADQVRVADPSMADRTA
jgi:hypothetical protein